MENREWTTIDKTEWERGPWDHEPDKAQWTTATGLPGLIHRNSMGALCGYAGVPPSHPWHGVSYNGAPGDILEVHGGITYSGGCQEGATPEDGICHVPGPGEPDDVWWFGFDCGHAWDLMPSYPSHLRKLLGDSCYRDFTYVKNSVEDLAKQLVAIDINEPTQKENT